MVTVSILMPAYNAATTIGAAVASVQGQTMADWELLVINDRSEDKTADTVQALARSDPRIKLLENEGQQGAAAARNTGLKAARGRYIAFLDADDEWLPAKLERQLALMAQTAAPLCYGSFVTRRQGRRDKTVAVPPSLTYQQLLSGNVVGCLTAIYDTKTCGKVPMPLLRRRHDYALWLRILKDHGTACGVTEPIAILHLASGTLSANKAAATYDTWRMYRDVVGLSAAKSLFYLFRHLTQRIFR